MDELQVAGQAEYFCAAEKNTLEAFVQEGEPGEMGVPQEVSIENFLCLEIKEGPLVPVRKTKPRGKKANRKGTRWLRCDVCQYTTRWPSNHRKHMKTHQQKRFKCDVCPGTFSTENEDHFKAHMWVHTGVKPFKCNKCSYATTRKHLLEKHKSEQHIELSIIYVE